MLSADNPNLHPVAAALGTVMAGFEQWIVEFFTASGLQRQLPAGFGQFSATDLAMEMQAETNAPMRSASLIDTSDAALQAMASDILKLAA